MRNIRRKVFRSSCNKNRKFTNTVQCTTLSGIYCTVFRPSGRPKGLLFRMTSGYHYPLSSPLARIKKIHYLFLFNFFQRWSSSPTNLRFILFRNDLRASQEHCGQWRIWTLGPCFCGLAREQWATISPTKRSTHRIWQFIGNKNITTSTAV